MEKYADTVLINGDIITVDQENNIFQGIAIKDNIIIFVGLQEEVKKFIGEGTKVIDLHGRSVLPGFVDSHMHLGDGGAATKYDVDCSYPNVKSIEDIKTLIKEEAKKIPKGELIVASRYNHNDLKENRHPTRFDLDEAAPDHNVALIRVCGHMAVLNSKMLHSMNIDENTPNPEGGEINRDGNVITGLLLETALYNAFNYLVRPAEMIKNSIEMVDKKLAQCGITSIHDAGGYGAEQMKAMQNAIETGRVKTRIYAMINSFYTNNIKYVKNGIDVGFYSGFGNDRLKIGCSKVMIDGASNIPTAAVKEPYESNSKDTGILCISQEDLDNICLEAHLAGFQITAHAVGDRAVEMMLNSIEKALVANPRKDHRHRIEHATIVNPEIINKMKKLGVIPVPQPIFVQEYGDCYLTHYGKKRCRYIFPLKSYINNGIPAATSSDWPVSDFSPLKGIHAAVNRITECGVEFSSEEKVTVMEAIRMFTYNGAYASFEEKIKGSLEVGKLADITVLAESILDCDSSKLKDIQVDLTMIDGEIVYQK